VPEGGLRFDVKVDSNGYLWWYVDGLSDDGQRSVSVIAFVGSVFSPYYAWARRRGSAEPANFCALNVALYERGRHRWSMTERPAHRMARDRSSITIGRSSVRWTGERLEILVDEVCAPLPSRLRGVIRLTPARLFDRPLPLHPDGTQYWTPFAPLSRIEVDFSHPRVHWAGTGYFDSNQGSAPLEDVFANWNWSRAATAAEAMVLYDAQPRGHSPQALALRFTPAGGMEDLEALPLVELPGTSWGIARRTRADARTQPEVVKALENAPFYSRTLLQTSLRGRRLPAIHESLDLDRFRARWVQCLLPFRMPRVPF
jgi:carotenoid 1,2-hydratase